MTQRARRRWPWILLVVICALLVVGGVASFANNIGGQHVCNSSVGLFSQAVSSNANAVCQRAHLHVVLGGLAALIGVSGGVVAIVLLIRR